MVDAQNERTNDRNRRRGRRRNRGRKLVEAENQQQVQHIERIQQPEMPAQAALAPESIAEAPAVRPDDIAPPTVRSEEYCIHHMASFTECEPMQLRTNMTTMRHLKVDHFGEATLYCDCLHNGPHQWPPSMQKLETAIELDQFLADSTSEA